MKVRLHILMILLLAVPTVFAKSVFAEENTQPTRTAKITISPDTTYITGPQFPDGRINYVKAMNQENAKGITKENNIIAGVFTLVGGEMEHIIMRGLRESETENWQHDKWFSDLKNYRERFWKMLGYDEPPPLESLKELQPPAGLLGDIDAEKSHAELLTVYSQEELDKKIEVIKDGQRRYHKEKLDIGKITKEEYEKQMKELDEHVPAWAYRQIINNEWNDAMSKFWTEKDFPYLAKWIVTTNELTNQVIDISRRPRYFHPFLTYDENESLASSVLLQYVQSIRQAVWFFAIRGNWDFAHGDYDKAFECAFAAIRLAQTTQKDAGCSVEHHSGIASESSANFQLTCYLAEMDGKKDAAWFLQKKQEYDHICQQTKNFTVPPKCVREDRFIWLSVVQAAAFEPSKIDEFIQQANQADHELLRFCFTPKDTNWDEMLRLTNQAYDQVEDITTLPGYKRQLRAAERFDEQSKMLAGQIRKIAKMDETSREQLLSDGILQTNGLVLGFFPEISPLFSARCRVEWNRRVISLAFALAAYRADNNGENPDSLEQLVPKYLDRVPDSPFTEQPMRYVKRANDILIPNDDYFKLDGSDEEFEKMLANDKNSVSGGYVYVGPKHFACIVQKKGAGDRGQLSGKEKN
ncbi:MAG: hypothetical protein FWC50_03125 [Planctomycetaceae bacterium]|nr:hypothetical protein [Planctomycetaceae bacterium]